MHLTTAYPIPRLSLPQAMNATPAQNAHLFRVSMRVMLLPSIVNTWTGWAATADQARDRAVEDARQRWQGYPLCVTQIVQVGI